jgi:hypothetical protein
MRSLLSTSLKNLPLFNSATNNWMESLHSILLLITKVSYIPVQCFILKNMLVELPDLNYDVDSDFFTETDSPSRKKRTPAKDSPSNEKVNTHSNCSESKVLNELTCSE